MTTVLDKPLKRQISIDGRDYTVTFDPDGVRLTGKGRRRAEVELRWRDLLSGEAALSVALNASLDPRSRAADPVPEAPVSGARKPATKKEPR